MQVSRFIAPAIAASLLAVSGLASAQNTPTSPTGTGSVSSNNEVRRGVPGVDVDVNTKDRGKNSGVPGVDVDVRNTAKKSGDDDLRRAGAGPAPADRSATDRSATDSRPARADRN